MQRGSIFALVLAVVIVMFGFSLLMIASPWSEDQKKLLEKDNRTSMLQMLDAMEQLMTGEMEYDRIYYSELRECMDSFDPRLSESQDAAWQGIIDYWNMGGTTNDPWGSYNPNYFEINTTQTNILNMTIYEPCNYASNIATYHVLTELCGHKASNTPFRFPDEYINALGTAFSTLAMSSSFMHGTHTELGHEQDTHAISVIAYLIHQASLSKLPGASSILLDLSYEPRNMSSLELADEFLNMYGSMPVDQWYNKIGSLEIPDYFLTFAGLYSSALTIAFEPEIVNQIIHSMAGAFALPDEILQFIENDYLPELRNLTSDLKLGIPERNIFRKNTIATTAKLLYSFLWQEQVMADDSIFLDPEMNAKGWQMLPVLNEWANSLNSYQYHDGNYQEGIAMYPGDVWCNPVYAHAKWHLESALGLLDLVYLGDEMLAILDL